MGDVTGETGDLAAWLREQITQVREAAVKAATADDRYGGRASWSGRYRNIITDEGDPDWAVFDLTPCIGDLPVWEHITLNDPASVIARCEAELAILDLYEAAVSAVQHPPVISQGQAARMIRVSDYDTAKRELAVLEPVVRLLGSGYRHRDGYRADLWAP